MHVYAEAEATPAHKIENDFAVSDNIQTMNITRSRKNRYYILTIKQDITVDVDISPLAAAMQRLTAKKKYHIALKFSEKSYLSTRVISPILKYALLLRDHGGALALIAPNAEIKETMKCIGLDCLVRIFASRDNIM